MKQLATLPTLLLLSIIIATAATFTFAGSPPLRVLDVIDITSAINNASDPALAYEIGQAVSAIAGIRNRNEPQLFVIHSSTDTFWLNYLRRDSSSWLSNYVLRNISSVEQLITEAFQRGIVRAAVVYDVKWPATSLVASTAAGTDDLLPVADRAVSPIYHLVYHVLKMPVKYDLRTVVFKQQVDPYLWAVHHLNFSGSVLAYYPDYSWVLDPSARSNGVPLSMALTTNHDFPISKKAFFFDLSPWPDTAPADYSMMLQIFSKSYDKHVAAGKRDTELIHLVGFPAWWYGAWSPNEGGVALEWQFAKIASSFNIFMDADACCIASMASASVYMHFPKEKARLNQNPAPTFESLKKNGYIDPATNKPWQDAMWATFYAGDFDSSAWSYSQFHDLYNDPNRGKVKIGWGLDPMLLRRFPVIFDWINTIGLSSSDRFTSGDSGFGYLNPTQLLPPRSPSNIPDSGAPAWVNENKKAFAQLNMSYTGFIINGDAGHLSKQQLTELYCSFSPSGMTVQAGYYPNGHPLDCGNGIFAPVFQELDLPQGNPSQVASFVLQHFAAGTTNAVVFRGVLKSATFYFDVQNAVHDQSGGRKVFFVEPLELALIGKLGAP